MFIIEGCPKAHTAKAKGLTVMTHDACVRSAASTQRRHFFNTKAIDIIMYFIQYVGMIIFSINVFCAASTQYIVVSALVKIKNPACFILYNIYLVLKC